MRERKGELKVEEAAVMQVTEKARWRVSEECELPVHQGMGVATYIVSCPARAAILIHLLDWV